MDFIFNQPFSKGKMKRIAPVSKKRWKFEPPVTTLLMVTKGHFSLWMDKEKAKKIEWGQLLLLSPGSLYTLIPEANTQLILFEIPDIIALMRYFFPLRKWKEKELSTEFFHILSFTPVLWEYTKNLQIIWEDNIDQDALFQVKLLELFSLLSLSYSGEQLRGLFISVLKEEGFNWFVHKNYRKVKTVEELARLSGHSLTAFEKRFKENFRMPPYKWMMERKKEIICYELTHSEVQIQDLADKCGFSSPSQMNDFCKKHIGLTPGMIRRKSKY